MTSPESQPGQPTPFDSMGQAAFLGASLRVATMRAQMLEQQQQALQRQLSILTGIAAGNGISPYGKYFPAQSSSKRAYRLVPPMESEAQTPPYAPETYVQKHLEHKEKGIRFPLGAVIMPVIPPCNDIPRQTLTRLTQKTNLSLRPNPAVLALGEPVPSLYHPKSDGSYTVRFK